MPLRRGRDSADQPAIVRLWWIAALSPLVAAGCVGTISLPLGGISAGRGQTLGTSNVEVSASIGSYPEVGGALPQLLDTAGLEVTLPADAAGARSGIVDPLGLTYGFTDRIDVGLSFSRGLHAFFRVLGNETAGLTLSPSIYRHSVTKGGSDGVELRRGRITNLSLAALGFLSTSAFERHFLEVYGGSTVSRYSAWIATEEARVERLDVVPSLLVGLRSRRVVGREVDASPGRQRSLGVSIEGGWTWIRNRDERRAPLPMVRVHLTVGGGGAAWRPRPGVAATGPPPPGGNAAVGRRVILK